MANSRTINIKHVQSNVNYAPRQVQISDADTEELKDVVFLNTMMMVVMCNYAQTGHLGGPLSYAPANVAVHLLGPENGGLRYDIRNPKNAFSDKFLLAGGHCIPVCYSLWIVLYEAMRKEYEATGDRRFYCDPNVAMLGVDTLGFRRNHDAVESILAKNNLADHPLFAEAKIRGIRALMGHSESTDVTNDVNGGPSGVGVAKSVGKALFWDMAGAPEALKVIAFEGEFAFTEGHAQELKTAALAQQVGKRLRIFLSENNAGIDDSLVGGVIHEKYGKQYDIPNQFYSYGWNVFYLDDGSDFRQLTAVFKEMENWPQSDRRPMVVVAKTIKGWWPTASDGKIGSQKQLIGYPSHPYGLKMNSDYFVALAESFEKKYGVQFVGIRNGPTKTEVDRLVQLKTNVDVVLSVLDKQPHLRKWITSRLLHIASTVESPGFANLPWSTRADPFKDQRLRVENLPEKEFEIVVTHPTTGKEVKKKIKLFAKAGEALGPRRVTSEIGKWINYVTNNRLVTVAADLSNSINIEEMNLLGHYDPDTNPHATRLKSGITEAVNAAMAAGLASQTTYANKHEHRGVWSVTGTYGAFTPLMYLPMRIFSQQNQDSPFALGVVTIVAGHSGPETAADARSHFGIYSPNVWTLFPRGQVINLHLWDYNDAAPAYFAALQIAARIKEAGIIVIHVARPDFPVVDRSKLADTDIRAAAKGLYLIREFDPSKPQHGTVFVQGTCSTVNLIKALPLLEKENVNVRIVSVISEDLFRHQPKEYQRRIVTDASLLDSMFITSMTKRIHPIPNLGPLAEEYSLSADFDDRWRSGGSESDIIAEARLDLDSIFKAVKRFANERPDRLKRLEAALSFSRNPTARL
eukprot:TRINITY_DN12318_c0_g1_i1.p1 TRINITY_DN12318_c0_g1~~TRINITY_DN12318_c0_g1_i1.p1  ORF type:complete len:879 (+),score=193.14 TRINITY_DN12318_c0_g1_i1:60-2639(+)